MKSNIKVSVIVPIYNMDKYCEQCITSIIDQTLKEIEIICIDDGSTDDSLSILMKLRKVDDRITIISQENQGVSAARNVGIEKAKGEFLSILDADDFFENDMLEKAYIMACNQKADICIFRAKSFDDVTKKESLLTWCLRDYWIPKKENFSGSDVSDKLFNLGALWAWDKLFKRDFIIKNNITFQNQRSSNDAKFVCIALAMANRICICDNAYAIHRESRRDSLSVTREQSWDCFYKAIEAVERELDSRNIRDYSQALRNWAVDFALWNLETIAGKRKRDVYYLIKEELIDHFDILNYDESYFLWPLKYQRIRMVNEKTYEEYIYWCHKNMGDINLNVKKIINNKIVLYGCGKIFEKIKIDFEVFGVCDQRFEEDRKEYEGFNVIHIDQIPEVEDVVVIICIDNVDIVNNLKNYFDVKKIEAVHYRELNDI